MKDQATVSAIIEELKNLYPEAECSLPLNPEKAYELLFAVRLAAQNYDPSHINRYLQELAGCFHRFYNACRCMVEDKKLQSARMKLADTVRLVLAYGLLPAFCEELVFRGIICAEHEKHGILYASAVSALFFAFLRETEQLIDELLQLALEAFE